MFTYLTYKDALLGLHLRGGAGSNSETEHHITAFLNGRALDKPVVLLTCRHHVVVEDVGVEDGPGLMLRMTRAHAGTAPEHAGTGFRRCGARSGPVLRSLNVRPHGLIFVFA